MSPFYLEEWIRNRIEVEVERDINLKHILGESRAEFNRILLEKFQSYKLHQILEYVYERSPFYRELFTKNQIRLSEVCSLRDLSRIPFTEAKDISDAPYRFPCVPVGKIARIFTLTSSDITSYDKNAFFTENDLNNIVDLFSAYTRVVGGEKKNVVQILLPGRTPLGQADLLAKGVEKAGSVPIITGMTTNIIDQVEAIKKNRSTILVGYPSYIYRLTQNAKQKYKLTDLGVNAIVTTGEYIPFSLRGALEKLWEARVFSHYGLIEMGLGVGIECHFHQGCHIDEADLIVEVINPDTGKVLPKGEEGELVITSLAREGMPLIRYRTRDLSRIIKGHCECGSFLKRIDTIAKRIGTEIEIGNDRVYPSVFDEIFFSIPEIIDYQIGVKREEEAVKLIFIVDALKRGKIIQTKIKEVILKHSLVQEMIRKNKIGLDIKYVPGCGNKDYCQYKRSSVFRV